jgi:dTDP-4-amino-4,6-dideoxygalactose transaminase
MNVPLVAPDIGEGEIEAVVRVLRSGHLAQGPEVAAFEAETAARCGVAHAVAVNSGTAAIHAGLAAFGVGPGDEVLTTPFTFAASATPILMLGATPRFADVDPHTFLLEGEAAAARCGGAVRAAVLVDLFGLPVDGRQATSLASRGVRVFEDACQAIGATRDGRPAGSIGQAASLSFYATKNVTAGEGGMLLTGDAAVAAAARRFRQHGQGERYEYLELGYNFRMTDVAAALGRAQLSRLDAFTAARRANAAYYDRELAGTPGLTLPSVPAGATHAYHQYSVLVDPAVPGGRDGIRAALAADGIATGVYYPAPLHLQPLFARCGYAKGDFPVAERLAATILALPVHPRLTSAQRDHVVRSLRAALGARA